MIYLSEIFGGFPGMFVYWIQIFWNFLYVCQSVSWLIPLLKLGQYRYISSTGWYIFLNFFGDIPGILVHYLNMILNFIYSCQSVCLLTSLPKLDKGIYPVLDEIFFWKFWRCSWDVGTLLPHNSEFLVCLSVCLFAYFFTQTTQI